MAVSSLAVGGAAVLAASRSGDTRILAQDR